MNNLIYVYLAASIPGFVISSLLAFSIISRRRELLRTHLDRLTLALISFCWLFATFAIIHCLFFIYLFNYENPFFLRQYDGVGVSMLLGSSQMIHSLISIERYFRIVKGEEPSKMVTFPIIGIFSSIILAVVAVMSIQGYTIMESGLWSFYDFSSDKTLDLLGNWLVTVFIVANTVTILFCYASVYGKIDAERRVISQYIPDANVNIAKKFLIIIVAYFLIYAASYLSFIYRLASRSRIAPELEIFCTFLTLVEPTITCSLLFYLNRNYRESVKRATNLKSLKSTIGYL